MMLPQQQRRRRRRAALVRTSERRLVVARGVGGFGFTIAGQRPCVVSAVAAGGPAERAGLRAGDALLAVDGANVARAPHASVARLVAAAPGAIALSVAPRESPPTDTEDTEPDERSRTRRRHPPPRRRPQANMSHQPGCHAAPGTSGMNEILHNLSRAQLTPSHAARLECRTVVGYLGTIETPQAAANAAPGNVRTAVRKLRQERRPATPVLLSVLPNALLLRRPSGQVLAQYQRDRIVYAGCGSEADKRFFGLVTSAEGTDNEAEASHSCHVFVVDPRIAEHEAHIPRAREFQIVCTRDPVAERCLEFPPSAEYVVGVIRGMYSLPADDCASPTLLQISKLAVKSDSPAQGNFARYNRPVFRPRERRICHEDARFEDPEFVANSPQPSNHSEVTTTSSNSDSGIGFHNDGRNVADRILVVDFAGPQPLPHRFRMEMPRRPIGLVGCNGFEDGLFLSNTTPVVDGFGGQGRPLNLDDVMLNSNDLQHVRHISPRNEEDNYNYNNIYGNIPSGSRNVSNSVYDQVYTENEGHQYEPIPSQLDVDLDIDIATETFNSVEIYEQRSRYPPDSQSNESVENVTVISGGTSKASMDSVSVYSSRSHEEVRPTHRKHLQASLDDMLVLGLRDPPQTQDKDEDNFIHPGAIKCKVRKPKSLNILSKTKHIFGKEREKKLEARSRALSASAGDVCGSGEGVAGELLPAAASEPDLRDTQSEQSSPFRRWTTGNGTGSSYRHHDHRNIYSKQMSEGCGGSGGGGGGVARWSLGLEHLLADPDGAAAFAHFLHKEFAVENIRFWWACEQYSKCEEPIRRTSLTQEIWQRHLAEGAPEPVNVDAAARRSTALRLHLEPPPMDLFLQAQKQIFNVMKFDSYPRFLRSPEHAECARADLRGLPPPFAPHAVDAESTPTKLKKSASNASERRRSGGALLLPWRHRGTSRDRAEPAPREPTPPATPAPLSNDVKSVPILPNLCRVRLPDKTSSVIEVDGAVTVKCALDQLLHKRNLPCTSYDVVLCDDMKCTTGIELSSPSSVLGGHEASIEQRCVVRLQVGGRCVAVRCRPQRRLRHVLRPVLAKYAPLATPQQHTVYAADGTIVSVDTTIQEVDGARLVVARAIEAADCVGDTARQEDSLSELAFRLQDDSLKDLDAQSGVSGSSAGRSECGSSCGTELGATGASRVVRAALRNGAPLHHHPGFVDDLRETQRLRLQRADPVPSPRSPPPLPPKPAPRQTPTVV